MDSANSISATAGDNLEARAWKLAMEKETIDLTMLEFISGSTRPVARTLVHPRPNPPFEKSFLRPHLFFSSAASSRTRHSLLCGLHLAARALGPARLHGPRRLLLRVACAAPLAPSRRVCRAARAGTPRPVASSHVTTEAPRAADGTALPPPSGTGEALTRCRLVEFVQVLVLVDFLKSSRAHSSPDYLGKNRR
jgi:hypothetical protein